jgi:hypothetical protein
VILKVDIEEELKGAQIKHIQKELEQLRFYYSDITDLEFLHILCCYEELLEIAVTADERLLLYKKMYQDCLNYLFHEIQSVPVEADLLDEDNENIVCNKGDERLLF